MTILLSAKERLDSILPELYSQRHEHWADRVSGVEGWEADPDLVKYRMLDATGMLHLYVARYDGDIAGYFSLIEAPCLHHKKKKVANHDLLFVKPEYKKTGAAKKLIKYALNDLKENGFDAIFSISIEDKALLRFWSMMGFKTAGVYLVKEFSYGS